MSVRHVVLKARRRARRLRMSGDQTEHLSQFIELIAGRVKRFHGRTLESKPPRRRSLSPCSNRSVVAGVEWCVLNGWPFWQYSDGNGHLKDLTAARTEYLAMNR